MNLRAVLAAFVLMLAPQTVFAEDAPAVVAPADLEGAIREVYLAVLFDTGIFDGIAAVQLPMFRDAIASSPYYRNASEEHRTALAAVAEQVPDMMREEFTRETLVMSANTAPALASVVTAEDLHALADLMRSPEWKPYIDRMIAAAASGQGQPAMSAEDEAAISRLEQTLGGRTLVAHGRQVFTALQTEMSASSQRITPRLQMRVARAICEAMEEECPEALRTRIGQT